MADTEAIRVKNEGKTLLQFPVLWQGWECDTLAWVVEHEGETHLIVTNHGGIYFGDEEFLRDRLKAYAEAVAGAEKALSLIQACNPTSKT
jgi:hypothetical protein